MRKVKLPDYPEFWSDLGSRIQNHIDASTAVSSHQFKLWMAEWYGINVYVMSSTIAGEVYMLESDYIAFVLRWA
jgi:hypothetical protein